MGVRVADIEAKNVHSAGKCVTMRQRAATWKRKSERRETSVPSVAFVRHFRQIKIYYFFKYSFL
jgi:hypothetical protein